MLPQKLKWANKLREKIEVLIVSMMLVFMKANETKQSEIRKSLQVT